MMFLIGLILALAAALLGLYAGERSSAFFYEGTTWDKIEAVCSAALMLGCVLMLLSVGIFLSHYLP